MSLALATDTRLPATPVTAAEQALRVDLAAAYRLAARRGWDDLIYTHITARVPGEEGAFLINPFGLRFDEITASSLVKIDLDGKVLQETPYFINPAGFTIHSAVHAAREDAMFVMHLHSDQGVAVASKEQSNGVAQISGAVELIEQATQRNAAIAEELASTAAELSAQAEQLQNVMASFRLSQEGDGDPGQKPPAPGRHPDRHGGKALWRPQKGRPSGGASSGTCTTVRSSISYRWG